MSEKISLDSSGYYTFNAFYTDRGPVSPQSIEDRDYDHDFSAVTYNLSK